MKILDQIAQLFYAAALARFASRLLRRTQIVIVCCLLGSLTADADNVDKGLKISRDVFYTSNHDLSEAMDIYEPELTPSRAEPLIVFIHGGGWKAGNKKDFQGQCGEFARRGFITASINYRFPDKAIWPAQAMDCKAAIRWLRAHASEFHIDPTRIAVGGHSAGGHLSAFLAASNGVKKFDVGENLGYSSNVQAELWFAGVADLISRATTRGYEGEQAPRSGESSLIGGPLMHNKQMARDASPTTWVSEKTAPFYFCAGTADKAVPPSQINEMKSQLDEHGVYSEVHLIPGADHGGGGAFFDIEHIALIENFLGRVLKLEVAQDDSSRFSNLSNKSGAGRYQIIPLSAPNLALSSGSSENAADQSATLNSRDGQSEQSWFFVNKGGDFYSIHPVGKPHLAVTVANNSNNNKTPVVLAVDRNSDTQVWRIMHLVQGDYYFLAPKSAPNCVLDNFSGDKSPGHVPDIWHYDGSDQHLQWVLKPTGSDFPHASLNASEGATSRLEQRHDPNKHQIEFFPPPYWNGVCFRELFSQPEQWSQTRTKITRLGYADHWLTKQFSDDDLKQMFAQMDQWNLQLCLEVGALNSNNLTGRKAFEALQTRLNRFNADGAHVWGIAMDEPLAQTRRFAPQVDAVLETAEFISLVRKNFPELKIGDIESHPYLSGGDIIAFEDKVNELLNKMNVRGLEFLRLDVDWMHFKVNDTIGKQGWSGVVKIEQACRKRHLPFSLIYWSANFPSEKRVGRANDETWEKAILEQGFAYRAAGGSPDEYCLESWIETPPHSVPERTPGTFAHSLLEFSDLISRPESH